MWGSAVGDFRNDLHAPYRVIFGNQLPGIQLGGVSPADACARATRVVGPGDRRSLQPPTAWQGGPVVSCAPMPGPHLRGERLTVAPRVRMG